MLVGDFVNFYLNKFFLLNQKKSHNCKKIRDQELQSFYALIYSLYSLLVNKVDSNKTKHSLPCLGDFFFLCARNDLQRWFILEREKKGCLVLATKRDKYFGLQIKNAIQINNLVKTNLFKKEGRSVLVYGIAKFLHKLHNYYCSSLSLNRLHGNPICR